MKNKKNVTLLFSKLYELFEKYGSHIEISFYPSSKKDKYKYGIRFYSKETVSNVNNNLSYLAKSFPPKRDKHNYIDTSLYKDEDDYNMYWNLYYKLRTKGILDSIKGLFYGGINENLVTLLNIIIDFYERNTDIKLTNEISPYFVQMPIFLYKVNLLTKNNFFIKFTFNRFDFFENQYINYHMEKLNYTPIYNPMLNIFIMDNNFTEEMNKDDFTSNFESVKKYKNIVGHMTNSSHIVHEQNSLDSDTIINLLVNENNNILACSEKYRTILNIR